MCVPLIVSFHILQHYALCLQARAVSYDVKQGEISCIINFTLMIILPDHLDKEGSKQCILFSPSYVLLELILAV